MKNVLMLILAVVIVMVVWGIVRTLIHMVLGPLITIGMLLLFCFLVMVVYRAMTGKQRI